MMPTMEITETPLFAGLSAGAKWELQSTCTLRECGADDVILAPGERGEFLYAIASGAVAVRPASGQRELAIVLGPGEVFGEMSLLSGAPVSAAVIAERNSSIYMIPARTFDRLFADEPAFRRGIADLLAERLRLRTSAKALGPTCAFLVRPSSASALPSALVRGVDHYAHVFEISGRAAALGGADAMAREIDSWRASARVGEVCVAACAASRIAELRTYTRPGDAVLVIDDGTSIAHSSLCSGWGMVDLAVVRIGAAARHSGRSDEKWSYRVDDTEINTAESTTAWDGRATPVLDSIARWIARRTIGIALGAGAARGFAHIGVLAVLDEAGIPVDCLSGTSIGGIVALLYAMSGSAEGAYDLARRTIGSNALIRDVSIVPRVALLRGRKVRRNAERISAGKHLSDLTRPALAVAADLITGRRVVLDRGLVASALVATAAIPGVLPPVKAGDDWLVDGALVTRVPANLLNRWRCGIKLAVNVDTEVNVEDPMVRARLRRALSGPFSLASIIGRSWELLGISQGEAETQAADIVINPLMPSQSSYDFDAIDSLVAAGRAAAEQALPDILDAVKALVRPRPR